MSLSFLAALAAAALTPRHSGAIAQRHGSPTREAPLHRGAFVPEFDNDSILLKMAARTSPLIHALIVSTRRIRATSAHSHLLLANGAVPTITRRFAPMAPVS